MEAAREGRMDSVCSLILGVERHTTGVGHANIIAGTKSGLTRSYQNHWITIVEVKLCPPLVLVITTGQVVTTNSNNY